MDNPEFLARVFDSLRAEILAMQGLRAKIYVFKLTALGAVYIAAASLRDTLPLAAILAVALAPIIAIFLDLSIDSMSLTIKQIGYYIRTQIEPVILNPNELGHAGAEFLPYELYLVVGRIRRRQGRPMSTKVPTVLALSLSALLLFPGMDVVPDDMELETLWYVVWLVLSLALITGGFIAYRIPRQWKRIQGMSGEAVLVAGAYRGKCECGKDVGEKELSRGQAFPDSPHPVCKDSSVAWELGSA